MMTGCWLIYLSLAWYNIIIMNYVHTLNSFSAIVMWCDVIIYDYHLYIVANFFLDCSFILILVNNCYILNLVIIPNEFAKEAVLMGAGLFSLRRMLTDETVWSFIDYLDSYLVCVNGKFFLLQTCSTTLEDDRDGLNHTSYKWVNSKL